MKSISFLSMLVLMVLACQSPPQTSSNWAIAFKNDRDGSTLLGSKEQLIDAIRKGASVRIGWGASGKTRTIEHLSDPIWLAVSDEQEVIARLDPQVGINANRDTSKSNNSDTEKLDTQWRVVISTKGTFDAVWYNRSTFTPIKRVPQRHPMTWFVKDVNLNTQKAIPLYEPRKK